MGEEERSARRDEALKHLVLLFDPEEVRHLRRDQVIPVHGELVIGVQRQVGRATEYRRVVLDRGTQRALRRYLAVHRDDELLFPSRRGGGPISRRHLRRIAAV